MFDGVLDGHQSSVVDEDGEFISVQRPQTPQIEANQHQLIESYFTLNLTPQDYLVTSPTSASISQVSYVDNASAGPFRSHASVVHSTPETTPPVTNSSHFCNVVPCQQRGFGSLDALNTHKAEAHNYRCEVCPNVGFPSIRDLNSRHRGPIHDMGTGKYRCGCCGKSEFRQDNHTRHLVRKRPCRANPRATAYTCGRCNHATYDKQQHLDHLGNRRGCETNSQQ